MALTAKHPNELQVEASHIGDGVPSKVVLSVQAVTKKIRGRAIIRGISFDIQAGEIFGFLGPNGSGKTTTIRMLVDLIRPTSGDIYICGHHVLREPEKALSHVGCIVENPEMYSYLTGWENLEHFARMQKGIDAARIAEVVEIVGMDNRIHDKVKTYSLGMRQRLGIAQALLGRPKLLILDEPTNGLDPKGIKELRDFIRKLAAQGMSLFISSHLLSEIQLMCDRVAIISKGELLAVGTVEELLSQRGAYVIWQFDDREAGIRVLTETLEITVIAEHDHYIDESILSMLPGAVITTMPQEQVAATVERLTRAGVGITAVQKVAPTLEELFITMTEGDVVE
ncbi:ABC-2 type transport system ATP-binding protein [Paenibacillus cellulosilyticus]|uniref:ABC-2 type transport system ATP-binding protein n=1 Tax=Paenibacillus cellulosilyticus TaxID=375489 RepID=A0A2V2Z4T5_9BACL|nr:ABC transporter ATP-binding protein [Paenibacillus cellulosilyticus]PWW05479.1 ABC-2 type transport system ATP-binding protein [Paenibacillus cellulosilyticus]QKS45480.1 ABC transporter ATP-binding protein [Paenibacillus cellulosilyticus]